MPEQELIVQKKRGRPHGSVRPKTVAVRIEAESLALLDQVAARIGDLSLSRSELIRRIVQEWLEANK